MVLQKQNKYNKFFLQWLIGFIDAEGNFQITKTQTKNHIYIKWSFHIGLSLKDKDLLYEIKEFLNVGIIYEYPHRNEAHFALVSTADLKILVSLFDNYGFFTTHQSYRYYLLRLLLFTNKKRFDNIDHLESFLQRPINCIQYVTKYLKFCYTNQVYNTYELNIIYSNWICGFITGEGSFVIRSTSNVFIFDIEQAERRVLDFIKAYFSFNPKVREKKRRLNRKQTYCLNISSKADLLKLISFLNNNDPNFIGLKGNKKMQYEIWLQKFYLKHSITV